MAAHPSQSVIPANGLEICHQTFGRPEDPALLLVMGFSAQMTAWPDDFCRGLADHGRFVIRFDNRDCGHSSKSSGPPPNLTGLMLEAGSSGPMTPGAAPYTLSDMAADAVGLLDSLGIERAHVVGASMGGMIVQHIGFEHPDRVHSVTSIMSTTGHPAVGQASPEALGALLRPPPDGREACIEQSVSTSRVISGPLWLEDEARLRAARSYDRMYYPIGAAFQLAAIMVSGDRTERLADVQAPFLVIHGKADPLIDVSGGLATAEAVPNADLLVLHAMGHDLPRPLFPQLFGAIHGITERS
jgi:pimeloyl-ACP methyl ester carboxylesterase